MPLKVIVGSMTKDAERMDVYPATTAKRVKRIEAWNGSAWKLVQSFAPPISLTISPDGAFGERVNPGLVTSNPVTATPTGGTAPFTYLWAYSSGDPVSIASPTTATTTFSTGLGYGTSASALYQCTVTDSLGETASDVVSVLLVNIGIGE